MEYQPRSQPAHQAQRAVAFDVNSWKWLLILVKTRLLFFIGAVVLYCLLYWQAHWHF